MTITEDARLTPRAEIGWEIRSALGARVLSIKWLADELGVAYPGLAARVRGDRPLPADELWQIADVLGIDPGDLFPQRPSREERATA